MSKDPKELIVQTKKEILDLYTTKNGLRPVLDRIKEVAMDFEVDLDTDKGRKLIASQAYAVSRSKTYLEEIAMCLTKNWREKTSAVNAQKKGAGLFLDELKSTIRRPLSEYEENEKRKIKIIEDKIALIENSMTNFNSMTPLENLEEKRSEVFSVEIENGEWGEKYEFKAFKAKDEALKYLDKCIEDRKKYDSEQEELAKLREIHAKKETKKRKKEEEIERIKKEKDREIEDAKERERVQRVGKEQAEARAREAERKLKIQEEENKKREFEKKQEEERVKKEKENFEREARENKRLIHNIILESLIESGIERSVAISVITLIGKNFIPKIEIDYSISESEKKKILKKLGENEVKKEETREETEEKKPSFILKE